MALESLDITRLSEKIGQNGKELRAEMISLRREMNADMVALRKEVSADFATFRSEVHAEFVSFRREVKAIWCFSMNASSRLKPSRNAANSKAGVPPSA